MKSCKERKDRLPYLNQPIVDEEHDRIGMSEYADYIKSAMDNGAEMIGVTADFGTGKSSLMKLVRSKCLSEKGLLKKYRIFEVNLWCHLEQGTGAEEIHKAFLYQLANQISPRLGSYVSKRMSGNYGLLQLRLGHTWLGIFVVLGVFLLGVSKVVSETAATLETQFTALKDYTGTITVAAAVLGVIVLWVVLTHSEILFSSKNSEGTRKWTELDAAELFHNHILKRRIRDCFQRTVIIIEDLDRSNGDKEAAQFLKEIRKYYLAPRKTHSMLTFLNRKITFVVNIKQETQLLKDKTASPLLYPKVFDFTLDLKKINIDNYEQILGGLLLEKKEELCRLGLLTSKTEITQKEVLGIPGISWMIYGRSLELREVKKRLNGALMLYESLCSKFGREHISFEKCAVVAYVTQTFPEEFARMEDQTLDKLMKHYLGGSCKSVEEFGEILKEDNEEYQKIMQLLVNEHLIDGSYRTYFYNYPKGSYLLSIEEELVQNVILYEDIDPPENIEELVRKVKKNRPEVLRKTFSQYKGLGRIFPVITIDSTELFDYVWKHHKKEAKRLLASLEEQYGADYAIDDNLHILQAPNRDDYFDETMAEELCALWKENYSRECVRELRTRLCETLAKEAAVFQDLFTVYDFPLNLREIDAIPDIVDILMLVCETNESWERESLLAIHQRIIKERAWTNFSGTVNGFYRFALAQGVLEHEDDLRILLEYMKESSRMWPDLEEDLVKLLEGYPKYHSDYVALLNQTAPDGWSEKTAVSIGRLKLKQGLDLASCHILFEKELYQDYLYHMVPEHRADIPFDMPEIIEAYREIETDLYMRAPDVWFAVRKYLIFSLEQELKKYAFLFGKDNPLPTEEELAIVEVLPEFLPLIPASKVTEEEVPRLAEWFQSRYRSSQVAYAIFLFLTELDSSVCRKLFYKMNLQVVNYARMSKTKKIEIRGKMTPILDLEDPMEALKYMEHIGEMDEVLERRVGGELQKNRDVREYYVKLVNQFAKPSDLTMRNLTRMTWLYHYCDAVEEKFYEEADYKKYVSSKILEKGIFEIEHDKKDVLWPSYLFILGSEYYGSVKEAIAQNHDFLKQAMAEKAYKGMREENRKYFAKVYQDADCLADAVEYGEDFLRDYLSRIAGFQNEAAAKEFFEILEFAPALTASDAIYENVHPKLVSPVLKGKYTRMRKQYPQSP